MKPETPAQVQPRCVLPGSSPNRCQPSIRDHLVLGPDVTDDLYFPASLGIFAYASIVLYNASPGIVSAGAA